MHDSVTDSRVGDEHSARAAAAATCAATKGAAASHHRLCADLACHRTPCAHISEPERVLSWAWQIEPPPRSVMEGFMVP
eukprot:COSAG01_NODE_1387_length_10508_cov_14.959939_9_plen_79_part_00